MNQNLDNQEYPKSNREHKSSLFCKAFEEKKYLLDLYNSINGTTYQNEDDLEVNTLENVVYVSMKKLNKNKTVDEIADELEEDIVVVQSIMEEIKRR